MEYRNGNTFGMIAFISFGMFWLSLVGLIALPEIGIGAATEASAMAAYMFVWSLFTLVMFIGTLRSNKATMFIFGSLALLFFLLGIGYATGSSEITEIAGYEGIIVGASAVYTAAALVLNEMFERTVLPVFPVRERSHRPSQRTKRYREGEGG